MKIIYRGFEIDAHREQSMGAGVLLYYSIFRMSDGYELESGFTGGTDRVQTFLGYLKEHVDDFIDVGFKGPEESS